MKYTKKAILALLSLKTNENLKKVALLFFIILGLGHILSGLMVGNGYYMPTSLIVNHILDIPFAMSALIYGFTNIQANVQKEKSKITSIIFIILTLIIFIVMLYINIFVPDKILTNI